MPSVASLMVLIAAFAAGCSGGSHVLPPVPTDAGQRGAGRAPKAAATFTVTGQVVDVYASGFLMQAGSGCGYLVINTTAGTTMVLNGLTVKAGTWAQATGTGSCDTSMAATAVSLAASQSGPFPFPSGTPTPIPSVTPVPTPTPIPTATPLPGPTPFSVTGQVAYVGGSGFLVQAGAGCGYLNAVTNGATQFVLNGQTLHAGVYARALGTGSCDTQINASVVSLAASASGPFPLPGPGPTPTPGPTPAPGLAYLALGDSITVGYGSSAPCPPNVAPNLPNPPNCPNGLGFAPRVARALNGGAANPSFVNLGINGAPINAAIQAIGNAPYEPGGVLANVTTNELPFASIATEDVITLYVGINDVNIFYVAATSGPGASNPNAYADSAIAQFGTAYNSVVNQIKQQMKPGAKLVLVNLPNMGRLPINSGLNQALLTRLSVGITQTYVNPSASQAYAVIDLLCDPNSYAISMLSSDGLHPNDAGYAAIASKVQSALTMGATPPASCPAYST
jgi:lysophospholipase L1-like esterase